MRTRLTLVASTFFFLIPALMFAGNSQHKIQWHGTYEKRLSEETTFKSLDFEGASYNEDMLPVYVAKEDLPQNTSAITAQLSNIVTEPLTDVSGIRNPSTVATDFVVTPDVSFVKGKPKASVLIIPVRRSASGGFEKLVSFTLSIQPTISQKPKIAKRTTSLTSVLANGDWYKVGVLQTGIYKIDYNLLKTMGVDVDNLDPHDIRIFGNGGGVLPYANSGFRYDDLMLNNIYVSGENDNHFDQQDYILFYGTNQTKWTYDSTKHQYNHQLNLYSDTTYYFITTTPNSSFAAGRIQQRSSVSGGIPVTSYDDYIYHEADIYNFLKSGREWFGETMDNITPSLTFNTSIPNLSTSDTVFYRTSIGVRSTTSNSNIITTYLNNTPISTLNFGMVGTSPQDTYLIPKSDSPKVLTSTPTLNVRLALTSSDPNVQAWLNYYEINFRRTLTTSGMSAQFLFRDSKSIATGRISDFQLTGANGSYQVWDITDPLHPIEQQTVLTGTTSSFGLLTEELKQFIAFNTQQYFTPVFKTKVANQNLHALAQADMIIVTSPVFYTQARELADFHRTHDNLSVIVQSTQEIFNEFSSGAQDVSAIRDFVKMFYDRAQVAGSGYPRFLCLFGDASYDNKYQVQANTNFVTSYQSIGSINQTLTYMSDDFFGLLDDTEGDFDTGDIVDLAVGRIPVKSVSEAQAMVAKIKHYVEGNGQSAPNPTLANWRNIVSFVGDDQDHDTHFKQADTLANRVRKTYPIYNVDKIYLDSYNEQSTPGGQRYPDAHNAIIDRVERGTLLISYIGHGGELGWAHERVLEVPDINNWSNHDRLAAFLTATCEFTRVDDPGRTSAGELVFLNPSGGGICLFTTSRLAFSMSNFYLCQSFFTHVFDNSSGTYPTTGEIFMKAKQDYHSDPYVRNFLLIGDPAVTLSYPKYNVKTKTINGVDVSLPTDTLKALNKVTITGQVQDNSGAVLTNFNGTIYPTVYDKMMTYYTLGNDANPPDISTAQPFQLQKNFVYGGKVSVINGNFSFSFVVPKDIAFEIGKGKISYYAQNGQLDAAGFDTSVYIGGINNNAVLDGIGPQIQLFMNDEKFVRGGMTDKDPFLYAIIKDSSGVNTVGTGIGHDMSAELDGNSEKKYVLNDYYENDLDSYQAGKVRYPFKDLASGPHTLTFKVWDVFNNSSEASTDFVVSESAELALDHVLNYPNPFTTKTTFMFEHNRPFTTMDVQVQIYTVSGKLIKTLSDRITPEGYRSDKIQWDGLDDFGDKIGKGVYVYRLRVQTTDGQYADKFEKLVILR
jgi:hypothetical protein